MIDVEYAVQQEMPLFVVMNASSGHGDTQNEINIVREKLAQSGRQHEIYLVENPQQLPQLAERAAEKVECSLRQNTKRPIDRIGLSCHNIQSAVTASANHSALAFKRLARCALGKLWQLLRVFDEVDFMLSTALR